MAHAEVSQAAAGEAMSPRRRSLAASLESRLAMLVEIPAALLVVAEIVILFAGVVARYGLHWPLIDAAGTSVARMRPESVKNSTPPERIWLSISVSEPSWLLGKICRSPTKRALSPRRRCKFPTSGAPRRCLQAFA